MPGRFSVGPLASGVLAGLRKRRRLGAEPPDVATRYALLAVPVTVAVISLGERKIFPNPADLLAGLALLAGANLAAFALIASWREQLNHREAKIDGARKRALDEAVAHILSSIVLATASMASMIGLTSMDLGDKPSDLALWTARLLTACGLAFLSYISLVIIIVANLLWDGYSGVNARAEETSLRSDNSVAPPPSGSKAPPHA